MTTWRGMPASSGETVKPNQVKVAALAIIWCGLVCYALTGLVGAMLLFNPPADSTSWLGVIGLWLVATALIITGNLFRVRALKQMGSGT
jgi:hypothetical protein